MRQRTQEVHAMNRIRSKALAGLLVLMTACGTGAAAGIATGTGTTDGTTTSSTAVMASTSTVDEPIVDVVAATTPSVVTVTSDVQTLTPFGSSPGKAVGTGFVVRSDGYIVTNHHVVADASSVSVTLSNGDVHTATVVAQDEEHDLAVLKIDADGLPALTLGDSNDVQIGETVVAIGFALDLSGGPTVTSGILSSLDRSIDVQDSTRVRSYRDLLQTDAALNHGNSGGPLLTLDGRVIGVDVAGGDGVENIGFAIPIDVARPLLEQAVGTSF
jgi:S1-C subfamily serine protease